MHFIQEHMPFDPLWQLLYHPVSFSDFNKDRVKEDLAGRTSTFLIPSQYTKNKMRAKETRRLITG